jgi:hypothetical protein
VSRGQQPLRRFCRSVSLIRPKVTFLVYLAFLMLVCTARACQTCAARPPVSRRSTRVCSSEWGARLRRQRRARAVHAAMDSMQYKQGDAVRERSRHHRRTSIKKHLDSFRAGFSLDLTDSGSIARRCNCCNACLKLRILTHRPIARKRGAVECLPNLKFGDARFLTAARETRETLKCRYTGGRRGPV